MLLIEFDTVTTRVVDDAKLVALTQFLAGRAKDTDAQKSIGLPSFLKLARQMGISLTADQLKDAIQRPPLNNLIANVEGDADDGLVIFNGGEEIQTQMPTDQAEKVVSQMAKRASS